MNLEDSMLGEVSQLQDLDEKSKSQIHRNQEQNGSCEGTREMGSCLPEGWVTEMRKF